MNREILDHAGHILGREATRTLGARALHERTTTELGVEIFERYTGGPVDPEHLRAQASKRVGLQFVVRSTASWDHRKLAGVY